MHSADVPAWLTAAQAQREQESNAEQKHPKHVSHLSFCKHWKNWTQNPAAQSQVAKVPEDLELLWEL